MPTANQQAHARAAHAQAAERRAVVRSLVERVALPVHVVLEGRELDGTLQAAVDRVRVEQVLRWVPEVSSSRAAQVLTDAGLTADTTVRLGDLPAGVRDRLASAAQRRLR